MKISVFCNADFAKSGYVSEELRVNSEEFEYVCI